MTKEELQEENEKLKQMVSNLKEVIKMKDKVLKGLAKQIHPKKRMSKEKSERLIKDIVWDFGERPFEETWETEAINIEKILHKHLK